MDTSVLTPGMSGIGISGSSGKDGIVKPSEGGNGIPGKEKLGSSGNVMPGISISGKAGSSGKLGIVKPRDGGNGIPGKEKLGSVGRVIPGMSISGKAGKDGKLGIVKPRDGGNGILGKAGIGIFETNWKNTVPLDISVPLAVVTRLGTIAPPRCE